MKSMKGIERIWPAMVSYSSSVNGGWKKKGEGTGEGEGSACRTRMARKGGHTLAAE